MVHQVSSTLGASSHGRWYQLPRRFVILVKGGSTGRFVWSFKTRLNPIEPKSALSAGLAERQFEALLAKLPAWSQSYLFAGLHRMDCVDSHKWRVWYKYAPCIRSFFLRSRIFLLPSQSFRRFRKIPNVWKVTPPRSAGRSATQAIYSFRNHQFAFGVFTETHQNDQNTEICCLAA